MKRVLITGMSGTGKTSVIKVLAARGYVAIETDEGNWLQQQDSDWVWDEGKVRGLLETEFPTHLFVSGCRSNQGKFYPLFDHVVLFSAPLAVVLERIASRTNNPYGKSEAERAEIIGYVETVEPLLRASASLEINTAELEVEQVADALIRLVNR